MKISVIATGFDAPVAARRVAVHPSERVRLPLTEEIRAEDSGYGVNLVKARTGRMTCAIRTSCGRDWHRSASIAR